MALMLAELSVLYQCAGKIEEANKARDEAMHIAESFDNVGLEVIHNSPLVAGLSVQKNQIPMSQGCLLVDRINYVNYH